MNGFAKKTDKNILWAMGINWLIAFGVFALFFIPNRGLFTLSNDFDAQEIAFNIFANRSIKSGEIFFNWAIDMGSDFTTSFSFYNLGSVFFWLSLLFPADMFPYLVVWIYMLKYATAGLTSYLYLRNYCKDKKYAIIGSVLYSFCGYQATNLVFYHFHDIVAFFPLLLIGLDYMVSTQKWGRMALAVFINALVNWNFFVGEVIFLVLYYLFRHDVLKRIQNGRYKEVAWEVVSCLVEGTLGVGMAAILFIPSVYMMLTNSRISNRILGKDALVFSTQSYLEFVRALLLPNEPMCYQATLGEVNWYSVAAYLPMIGIIFVMTYLAANKQKWIAKLLWVSLIFAVVPLFNSFFVLFYYEPYRRWFYMPILIMVLASVIMLEQVTGDERIRKLTLRYAKVTFLAIMILVAYLFLLKWSNEKENAINDKNVFLMYVLIAVFGIIAVIVCVEYYYKNKRFANIVLSLVSLFSALTLFVNIKGYRKNADWDTSQEVYNEIMRTTRNISSDIIPYRYAMNNPYYNRNMANSLTSIDSFISIVDNGIFEFYDALDCHRHTLTNDGPDGTNELLSVKYYVMDEKWDNVTPVAILDNGNRDIYLYEDVSVLPIGFTYDFYITKSEFDQMEREDKSHIMMRVLVVADNDIDKVSGILSHYNIANCEDFSVENKVRDILSHHQECSIDFFHSTTGFFSKIVANRDKYAFFSVPYGERWSAKVNDIPVEILNINGLMAVPVQTGENRIEFKYSTDINKWSLLISLVSTCAVFFLYGTSNIKSKKRLIKSI